MRPFAFHTRTLSILALLPCTYAWAEAEPEGGAVPQSADQMATETDEFMEVFVDALDQPSDGNVEAAYQRVAEELGKADGIFAYRDLRSPWPWAANKGCAWYGGSEGWGISEEGRKYCAKAATEAFSNPSMRSAAQKGCEDALTKRCKDNNG